MQMERLDCDICSAQSAFQATPKVFQPISVNPAIHVLLHVIHKLVDVVLRQATAQRPFIGVNLCAVLDVLKKLQLAEFGG
jgi:hypothetical protein